MFAFPRRQTVGFTALVGVALLVLALCPQQLLGQGYGSIPEDALIVPFGVSATGYDDLQEGDAGGTLRLCTTTDPETWNDAAPHSAASSRFTNLMFDPLLGLHPNNGEPMPQLALSWDIVGSTITFHLREDIRWSDGTLFTADDVVFTYNDVYLTIDPIVAKTGAHTVTATYTTPVTQAMLLGFTTNILPQHALTAYVQAGTFDEAWGVGMDPSGLVGMGPFLVSSYTPGVQVTMQRNPYYYQYDPRGVQLPYFDTLEADISLDASGKLLAGEIDATGIAESEVTTFQQAAGITVTIGGATYGTSWVACNMDAADANLRTLFRKVEFRRAVAHALNKPRIIQDILNGFGYAQWSLVSIPSPYYAGRDYYGGPITETSAVTYPYSLTTAATLLDQCGIVDISGNGIRQFADETPVSFTIKTNTGNATREGTAAILAEDLVSLGLDVTVDLVAYSDLVNALFGGAFQAIILGLTGGDEPDSARNVYSTTGSLHFWHYSAATGDAFPHEIRINELFDLGLAALNAAEAFAHYEELQTLQATDDLGMVFTVQPRFVYAIASNVGNKEIISSRANAFSVPELLYRIGLDSPSVFRVDCAGTVFADGTLAASDFQTGAADVAEWVEVTEAVEPGDVVVSHADTPLVAWLSREPCSHSILGVVSTEPGVVLGSSEHNDPRALLALTGIVPVKVTDEGGPIQPGDLLVTSSTPGHAMRWAGSEPCPYALVGKALEPMSDDYGVILVLLTAH
jgi:peptide/nickel transport system substrate-binding protein